MIPKILDVVWGKQEGYVCLSTKTPGDKKSWSDNIYSWPQDRPEIAAFIDRHSEDYDVYWAPMVFSQPRRSVKYATECPYLWADLDPVSPHNCFIKPSIAWESSPGRYQCIWLLSDEITPLDHDELNKRMTYAVEADKSGWDITQVLRLPGTLNHKYVEKPPVKLMWMRKNLYDPQDLANQLPAVGTSSLIDVDELDIELNDLRELVWPYRRILGDKLWELLFTPSSQVQEGERSTRIWELEARLIEANIPISEVVKIAKASPWNKYRGRKDENTRILQEVLKAEKRIRQGPIVSTGDGRVPWVSYSRLMGQQMVGPGWLIEGIWANNSHGMIAGEPKTYKSIISTEIAVSVASGLPMWDTYKVTRQGPVMIIQEENAPWVVKDRLQKVAWGKGLLDGKVTIPNKGNKVKPGKIYVEFPPELPIKILNNWGFDLTQEEHRAVVEAEIDRVRPVLIILDPLYLMLGDIDDNSAQGLRSTLSWLLQLKVTYNTSIMILHHWNKGGQSGRGGQRMLGSTTLHAWVESALYTSVRDPDKNEVTVEREFRSFMKPDNLVMTVAMSEPGKDPSYDVKIVRNAEKVEKKKADDVLQYIRSNGSCYITELVAYTGLTDNGVKKMLQKYAENGMLHKKVGQKGRGRGSSYSLSDKGRRALEKQEREASDGD